MEIKQLEAIAKELAQIIKGVMSDANKEIIRLSAEVEELKAVQHESINIDSVAKQAAALVVLPDPIVVEPEKIDLDALAVKAAELVSVPEPELTISEDEISSLVEMVKDSLPKPEKGERGEDGKSVDREDVIKSVSAEFERRFSDLLLHLERKAHETFEKAVDKMPRPTDGKDALPLESFDIAMGDDGRTLTVKMQAGDYVQEKSIKLPVLLDRGAYGADKSYEAGDVVSHGGSMWIASDGVGGAPGLGGNGWRLAVKRGRDGKDLRDNAKTVDTSKGVSVT